MSRLVPFMPIALALWELWLLLNWSVSPGHLLIGFLLAVFGSRVLGRLELPPLRIRKPLRVLQLLVLVTGDIIRSNLTVALLVLRGGRRKGQPKFLQIPLDLTNPWGIALLAAIISSTPGTIWGRYNRTHSVLLLHVFDMLDEAEWVRTIKDRYEKRVMEIFE